jgi:glycosyltransferase involved in cell wall biosynthesis
MKLRKDILFLCQYFYPEYVSSATLPFDTAEALVEAGFGVDVICGYPKEYNNNSDRIPLKEIHKEISIRRIKYIQLKRNKFISRIINYFSFTFAVFLRLRHLRSYRVIVVYSNPPVLPYIAALAKKLFKAKVVFVCYDVYPEIALITNSIGESSIICKMMKYVNGFVFKHVDKVVALSSEMKDYLLKNRVGLKDQQVVIIPNWYEDKTDSDNSKSYNNEIFKELATEKIFIVSYLGNMGICQDLDTIFKAIIEVRNNNEIKFLFAGHGSKMEVLKAKVKEQNLRNVTIYDFLHGQDFQDALNISDCFLVSLADGLTGLAVPSKTYCYMMAGKPIIAIMNSNTDISKDLAEHNAGYTVEVGEVSKLVSAMNELKNNKLKREQMGRNCRSLFLNKYTKTKCTLQYVEVINDLLKEH